jgi:16S rRNA processing protein RimM
MFEAFKTNIANWPQDAVEVGRIAGAYGIRGMIKAAPASADGGALMAAKSWWIELGLVSPQRFELKTRSRKLHGGGVVCAVEGVEDRNLAEKLHGATIFVSRSVFPKTANDEYYWVDLIGLPVSNREGVALGAVIGLIDNGAQQVLRVVRPDMPADTPAEKQEASEILIPFVSHYVDSVSLADKRIVVDWQLDY